MSVKRIVDVNFWNDDKVLEYFSPEDKLFMLYLMTNPHTTQLGIYSINKKHIAFEIGYSLEAVSILLERFENKYKMIKYSNETKEIAIKNYLKHSIIKGGKPVEDLLNKEIKQVKDKSLLNYVFSNLKNYNDLNETIKKIVNNTYNIYNINNKLNNNEIYNDNDNEKSYPLSYNDTCHDTPKLNNVIVEQNSTTKIVKEVVDYLNLKLKTNYKYTTAKTRDKIIARINEGFTLEDFKRVIDIKFIEWKGTEFEKFLRPETLFGNKFESYLNQKINKLTLNNYAKTIDISEVFNDE